MATSKKKIIDLNISPKLVNILERISNKSEIAKRLLKFRFDKEELVEDPIDFISISKEDPTKLTYLTTEKIAKSGIDRDDIEEIWTLNKIPAKPGVAFKKLFKDVHEKDVELFTTLFKAAVSQKDFELKILTGDEMVKYYGYRSYHPEIPGTLHNSCMKHDHCQDSFDIYTKNPEVCQMLVMLDNRGKLLGRTLLWKAIDAVNDSEVLIMDRIYCVDDSKNMHYFKEWADQHGYLYKKEQRWQNCMFFESHGSSKFLKLHVKIKKKAFVKYPYVDTFKFWDEKKSLICNYLPSDNGYVRTLMGNNGNTLGGDVLGLDTIQKLYVHREHLIYLPYIDGRIHADYSIWSETMQTSIARDHAIYSEDIKDYIFNTEYSKFNDKVRFNARKEQIRRMNEQKSKKMVSSKRSRSSNSVYYNGGVGDFIYTDNDAWMPFNDTYEPPPPEPAPRPAPDPQDPNDALRDTAGLWERIRGGSNRGRVRGGQRPGANEQRDVDEQQPQAENLQINNNTELDQLLDDLAQAVNIRANNGSV